MTGIRNTGRRKSRRGELDVGKVSEKCRKNVGKEQNDPKDDPKMAQKMAQKN